MLNVKLPTGIKRKSDSSFRVNKLFCFESFHIHLSRLRVFESYKFDTVTRYPCKPISSKTKSSVLIVFTSRSRRRACSQASKKLLSHDFFAKYFSCYYHFPEPLGKSQQSCTETLCKKHAQRHLVTKFTMM